MQRNYFVAGSVYRNRPYFENSGPDWSKRGSIVDKHHILNVVNLTFV